MNKTAKIISVILAVVMALSVLPFAAFAAEEDDARVASWKQNYSLLLKELFDNDNYTSWKYVDENRKSIDASTAALTAFALYDGAWTDFIAHGGSDASPENAKLALLALTEKAAYEIDDGYVDEFKEIIDTAEDVNDMIQKVNAYLNIELFASQGWSETFKYIGYIGQAIDTYQNARDKFVAAYAEILSVQMANMYYVDMLKYIVDKENAYAPLKTAAQELIAEMQAGVEEALQKALEELAGEAADAALNTLATAAMDSNVYTAAALKIYQVGTSVVDVLWNTSDLYPLFDTIRTSYYYQSYISEWAEAAVNGADSEKAFAAVSYAISAREFSEDSLLNLKKAQDDGAIGKVQRKLYGTVYNDIEVNKAMLATMRKMFYKVAPDAMKEVKRVLTIYCPVNVEVMNGSNAVFTFADGSDTKSNDYGVFTSAYSEYAKTYHKVVFLYDACRIRLVGTGEGYVTLVMDALKNGAIEDWSFTDRKVAADTKIVFDTNYSGVPYYVASDANGTINFNDVFVPSEQKEVTVKEIITATAEVGKDEAKSFLDKIMDFFRNLFDKIASIFKK